jgi:DNA (cytosine-5)-methyltransferase 1
MMRVGSLFSGCGGMDLGLERAGLRVAWQVEIDKACRKVLEWHWPGLTRLEDVRDAGRATLSDVDLLCGGFPCQDISVAGRGAGLAGKRSGLYHELVRVVAELAPRWVLVENVPALLGGRHAEDFATVLQELCGWRPSVPADGWGNTGVCSAGGPLWYGVAWRVLDSQLVGGCALHLDERGRGPVPQQRRRVFLVARLGDSGAAPAAVLLEPGRGCWDPETDRAEGEAVAATVAGGSPGSGGYRNDADTAGNLVAYSVTPEAGQGSDLRAAEVERVAGLTADAYGRQSERQTFIINSETSCATDRHARESTFARCLDTTGGYATAQGGTVVVEPSHRVAATVLNPGRQWNSAQAEPNLIVFDDAQITHPENRANPRPGGPSPSLNQNGRVHVAQVPVGIGGGGTAHALGCGGGGTKHGSGRDSQDDFVLSGFGVRRLTEVETERLQGLPDGWTAAPGVAASRRYMQVGNAVTATVAEWIGRRLAAVEATSGAAEAARRTKT